MLIDRPPRELSPEENLNWLTVPQPELDPRLFGPDKQLLPDVRQKLLRRADVLVQNCVVPFAVFDVDDVVICGSADSYFYHQFSDIDLTVLLKYRTSDDIFDNAEATHSLIAMKVKEFYKSGRRFEVNNRFMEIKTALSIKQRQLYSVLKHRWIAEPSPDVMAGVDKAEVMAAFIKAQKEIGEMRQDRFERINGKFKLKDLRTMQEYYNNLIRIKSTSAQNLLLNKLLRYSGDLQGLENFYKQEAAKTLSF